MMRSQISVCAWQAVCRHYETARKREKHLKDTLRNATLTISGFTHPVRGQFVVYTHAGEVRFS